MRDGLIISALSIVPRKTASRIMGVLSRTGLSRLLIRLFAWRYRIDLTECQGEPGDFDSLSAFFLRPLLPGARPVDTTPGALISPVDGTVHTFGRIIDGRFTQSETRTGSIAALLGATDPRMSGAAPLPAERFEGGHYAVIYLSPQDYHRVHTPCAGQVVRCRYLPGQLWPVFPAATRRVAGLFDHNERLIFALKTDNSTVLVAMIGAFGVGRMSTPLADIVTNTTGQACDAALSPPVALERGAELGRFGLGSTVILLIEPGPFSWSLAPGQRVKLARPIGHWG